MNHQAAVLTAPATSRSFAAGLAGLAYAGLAYVLFLLTFTGFAAAVTGLWAPWAGRTAPPVGVALAVNAALVLSFAVQHVIMARHKFKQRWTQIIPAHIERSTFVLIASTIMAGIIFFWQPIEGQVWSISHPVVQNVLRAGFVFGYLGVVASSFLINHFHLFGLQQSWRHFRGLEPASPTFYEPGPYRKVRHPMMTSMLIMMWSTPQMSVTQVVLACLFTAYALTGVLFEEKGLAEELGESYRDYLDRVPTRVIPGIY